MQSFILWEAQHSRIPSIKSSKSSPCDCFFDWVSLLHLPSYPHNRERGKGALLPRRVLGVLLCICHKRQVLQMWMHLGRLMFNWIPLQNQTGFNVQGKTLTSNFYFECGKNRFKCGHRTVTAIKWAPCSSQHVQTPAYCTVFFIYGVHACVVQWSP